MKSLVVNPTGDQLVNCLAYDVPVVFIFAARAHVALNRSQQIRHNLINTLTQLDTSKSWELNDNRFPYTLSPTNWNVSLSHSNVSMAVAITPTSITKLGVDIEDKVISTQVANRFYAPAELNAIQQLSKPLQNKLIQRLWSIKEAYIKATGLTLLEGLKLNLIELLGAEVIQLDIRYWQHNFWHIHAINNNDSNTTAYLVLEKVEQTLLLTK